MPRILPTQQNKRHLQTLRKVLRTNGQKNNYKAMKLERLKQNLYELLNSLESEKDIDKDIAIMGQIRQLKIKIENQEKRGKRSKAKDEPMITARINKPVFGNRYRGGYK